MNILIGILIPFMGTILLGIKWENLNWVDTKYPHIYGALNKNAIIDVLPHL